MAITVSNRIFHRLTVLLTPGPAILIARILWPFMLISDDLKVAFRYLSRRTWSPPQNYVYRRLIHLLPRVPAILFTRMLWLLTSIFDDLTKVSKHLVLRTWVPPSNLADTLQYDYDIRVVPQRAQHPGLLAWPLHRILRVWGIVFVVNMVPGMGHNTVELDYFLRLLRSGRIPSKRYVLLRRPSPFHDDTLVLYRRHFWFASNSVFLSNFLAPVIARYEDLRLNVGLSRLRWQLRNDGSWTPPPAGQSFLYQIDKAENRAEWMRYYKLRRETRTITPLKDELTIEPALLAFLGARADRLALVHVKYHVANATARPTDPQTYLPAIRWLQDQGYKVVMIGREGMPKEFAALGVLDYANSSLACYRFDLELVAHAAIVITAGSGIAMMPDCMDVPLVYLNSWHIGMPMASARCVMVPTMMMGRASGRLLSFAEQCDLYWTLEDKGAEIFPTRNYEPRDATGDEVLEAVKESLAADPDDELTPRQNGYRRLTLKDGEALIGARISRYFIDKHAQMLGG